MGLKYAFLTLFLSKCGPPPETEEPIPISPILIEEGVQRDEAVAFCYRFYYTNSGVIFIDQDWWSSASETQRKIIIMHERGHCDYYITEHIDGDRDDGCPYSIMNAYIPSDMCYNRHRDSYEAGFRAIQDRENLIYNDGL